MSEYKVTEGTLDGAGLSFAIVVGRFNHLITDRLLEGCVDCLVRHGVQAEDIEVVRVPGSWEIPVALKWLSERPTDGIITLGCVIRGGTPHFDYVAAEVTKGAASVQMNTGIPVTLGVLTTDTINQAIERAGTKHGNKGWEAAMAALEIANVKKQLA